MPLVSFVVIAYNVRSYISECLQSLKEQTLDDFEVIVIDDASTDGTRECIDEIIKNDHRFRLIPKSMNEGAHLARRTGVLATTGEYVFFIDGDDYVSELLCEQLSLMINKTQTDIIRFGVDAFPEGESDSGTAKSVELVFNSAKGIRHDGAILESVFSDRLVPRETWSITVCAYRGDFVRHAFSEMTSSRLGYMEDTYEFFVAANEARELWNYVDFHALKYRIGAGRSGWKRYTADEYIKRQQEVHDMYLQLCDYCATFSNDVLLNNAKEWMHKQYLSMLCTDWVTRLSADSQRLVFSSIVNSWGAPSAGEMLLSPIQARAKWLLPQNTIPAHDDDFYRWSNLLETEVFPKLSSDQLSAYGAYYQLKHDVERHTTDIMRQVEEQAKKQRAEALQQEQERGFVLRAVDKVIPEGSLCRDMIRVVRAHKRRAK